MLHGAAAAPLRVVGRYALFGEIAAGGMATVHIGRLMGPAGFTRTVAIKRLHPQYAKDPEFVSMFLDEGRVAARIQHPNVVPTVDVVAEGDELFLVMDYVEGESLARVLRGSRLAGGGLPPRIAAAIVVNLLNGLHAAHEARSETGEPLGIVHRDVSPQNVHIGTDGIARVLDFGVAKAVGRAQVTREGQVKGKVAYMPPEQIAGGVIDRRLDVYASAVVLWESLTGERLFAADNEAAVLSLVLSADVRPPSSVVPSLPRELDQVVMRGLSRNPSARFSTALEMATALEGAIAVDSPRKVAAFLNERAGDSIAKRAARVKEVETLSSGWTPGLGDVGPQSETASLLFGHDTGSVSKVAGVSLSERAGPRRSAPSGLLVMAMGAAMLMSAVIGIALFGTKEVRASGVAHWSYAAVFPRVGLANAQATLAPASVVTATSSASPGPAPPSVSGAAKVATPAWNASAPKPKPDCRQPKVFVNGIWKYRPECMDQ